MSEKRKFSRAVSEAPRLKQTKISFTTADALLPQHAPSALFVDKAFPPVLSSIDGRKGDISSKPLLCNCGAPAKVSTVSKDGPHRGRFFQACATRTCPFFVFTDQDVPHEARVSQLQWERFSGSNGYRISGSKENGFRPQSILQGSIGDCWLLSALSVISERKDLIEKIVLSRPSIPANGKLDFRLFLDGHWRNITVDNFLPVRPATSKALVSSLHFSRCDSNSLMLVPFLEKAYAKAHGSYAAISGGWVHEALFDLTGCPCAVIDFSSDGFDSELEWTKLVSFFHAGFPMGCATSSKGEGIVSNHAYSILEVRELSREQAALAQQKKIDGFFQKTLATSNSRSCIDLTEGTSAAEDDCCDDEAFARRLQEEQDRGHGAQSSSSHLSSALSSRHSTAAELRTAETGSLRLLRVRNPWGKTEFTGSLGAKSDLWTAELRSQLDQGQKNDGTFWISYHDFLRHFSQVDVCKAHEGWMEYSLDAFTLADPSTVRCQSSFMLELPESTWLYLTIVQMTKRGKSRSVEDQRYYYLPLSLLVEKLLGERGATAWKIVEICGASFCGPQRLSETLELLLEPGCYRVSIINFQHSSHKQVASPYVLRVYSSKAVIMTAESTVHQAASLPHTVMTVVKAAAAAGRRNKVESNCNLRCISRTQCKQRTLDSALSSSSSSFSSSSPVEVSLVSGVGVKFVLIENTGTSRCEVEVGLSFANYAINSPFLQTSVACYLAGSTDAKYIKSKQEKEKCEKEVIIDMTEDEDHTLTVSLPLGPTLDLSTAVKMFHETKLQIPLPPRSAVIAAVLVRSDLRERGVPESYVTVISTPLFRSSSAGPTATAGVAELVDFRGILSSVRIVSADCEVFLRERSNPLPPEAGGPVAALFRTVALT